jgi:hypothetical protein
MRGIFICSVVPKGFAFSLWGATIRRAVGSLLCAVLLCATGASAQLAVTVWPVKISGSKAVVSLAMKNNLASKVESARAVCFLLDDRGKMVGESTKWVIGKSGLEPKGETTFNFVVASPRPFTTTNLTAKVSFSRLVLEGGKVIDATQNVQMKR